ncbi:hypothetical protein EBT16_07925, partial [bacterium]|nr:hypothetical protein [bacterium]
QESPEFAILRAWLENQKQKMTEKAAEWTRKILKAIEANDLETVKTTIEELLIEDQMFLKVEQEREAFGKPLKEFSASERKELVMKFTLGQKEVREKLLTEVARLVQANPKAGAESVGRALQDIKKDHLEAYDRVIKEIKAGTVDTETTFCFTCGEGDTIGQDGYTFGGAMREAANRVMAAFAEKRSPAQTKEAKKVESSTPAPAPAPKPKPQPASPAPTVSAAERAARKSIEAPVLRGSRAQGNNQVAFESYLAILKSDPSLSEQTLKRFLKSGYYGSNNPDYRARIDAMSRDQLLNAVQLFMNGEGPYNHCPSCNLGAGRRLH